MLPIREVLKSTDWPAMVVAHRGMWCLGAPENSVLSIDAAVDHRIMMAEIDIAQSLDDTLFCLHDPTLDRTTDRVGYAALKPWSELAKARLKPGNGKNGRGASAEILPTLADMLESARGRIYLDVDVKHQRQIVRVAEAINAAGMGDQVILKQDVTSRQDLEDVYRLQNTTGCVTKPILTVDRHNLDEAKALIKTADVQIVEVLSNAPDILAELAAVARDTGIDVFVNTLDMVDACPFKDTDARKDPEHTWGALIRMGVRLIQTDAPHELQSYIESHAT